MSSRRTFLKTSAAFAATLPLARLPLGAAETGAAAPAAAPAPKGLLFAPSELPRIRANLDLPRCTELRRTLLDYLKKHPEEADFNAAILVGNAFIEAFPCD